MSPSLLTSKHLDLRHLSRRQNHFIARLARPSSAPKQRGLVPVRAGRSNSIVILPGLGNNKKDYEPLAALLRERDLTVEIADVSRPDWYAS